MPQYGQGIIPAPGAVASELTAVVHRAFLPKVIVQIWKSAPTIASLMSAAQVATGGLSPITVPVQGAPMVSGQWVDYSGSFNQPANMPGIQPAEFNLKAYCTPIPFLGMEGLVQVDYSVVPLIDARMNDATNVTIDTFATTLFNNIANTQQMIGLPSAIDDGTFANVYGGIPRSTNQFWRSTYVHNTGTPPAPTRNLMLQYNAQVTKVTGEMPSIGIMGFGTWTQLATDFTPNERYNIRPASDLTSADFVGHSSFHALDIAGIPYYADPYCPEGLLLTINSNYLSLFMHERAAFKFTGFESTLPNMQFGYISAILTLLELVNVKPKAHGKFDGLAYLAI